MKSVFKFGKFKVTQTYHTGHLALDVVGLETKEIVAVEDGTVIVSRIVTDHANKAWTYGNYVVYQLASGRCILCAHMSKRLVSVGDKVKAGQVIGIEGSTGNSTGSHCHVEYRESSAAGATRYNVAEYLGIPNAVGTYDPGVQPTGLTVVYQAYVNKGGWLPEVWKADDTADGYAGLPGVPITAFRCRISDWQALHYRAHKLGGNWWETVGRWADDKDGYAGNKKDPMDYLMIWSENGKRVRYRVKVEGKWLAWIYTAKITDRKNGMAGVSGKAIEGVQVELV